jgi:hypothetical protein
MLTDGDHAHMDRPLSPVKSGRLPLSLPDLHGPLLSPNPCGHTFGIRSPEAVTTDAACRAPFACRVDLPGIEPGCSACLSALRGVDANLRPVGATRCFP